MDKRSKAQHTGFALIVVGYLVIMIMLLRGLGRILLFFTQGGPEFGMRFLLGELGVLALGLVLAGLVIGKGFRLIRRHIKQ